MLFFFLFILVNAQDAKKPQTFDLAARPALSDMATSILIILCSAAGFAFAMYWWYSCSDISLDRCTSVASYGSFEESSTSIVTIVSDRMNKTTSAFLLVNYKAVALVSGFIAPLLLIFIGLEVSWLEAFLSVVALLFGILVLSLGGYCITYIGNYFTPRATVSTVENTVDLEGPGVAGAYLVAFRGGVSVGFSITSFGLFAIFAIIKVFLATLGLEPSVAPHVYGGIMNFALGSSIGACLICISGGIYTKGAEIGADMIGKVEKNMPEDSGRNPAVTIATCGRMLCGITGLGMDLLSSLVGALCAAMLIASTSAELSSSFTAMMYPLLIMSLGIVLCLGTMMLSASHTNVARAEDIEPSLKRLLIIAAVVATAVMIGLTDFSLPEVFIIEGATTSKWYALVCVLCGIWTGLLIAYSTDYFTSNAYRPVQQLAESGDAGASATILNGLSLASFSVIPQVLALVLTIYTSHLMAGMYGFALAALGYLTIMCTALSIATYAPIADSVAVLSVMLACGSNSRDIATAMTAAGNITSSIGKGFALNGATLVSLALYGAFISRAGIVAGLSDQRVMAGLIVGAMLPYWIAGLTMRSAGLVAGDIINEIRRQFRVPAIAQGTSEPDHDSCGEVAVRSALRHTRIPVFLMIIAPLIIGVLFGSHVLAGMLPGALLSGALMAIFLSNAGMAWTSTSRYIAAGGLRERTKCKGSPYYYDAKVGESVGGPLKDLVGPSLAIMIRLMLIISIIFSPLFSGSFGGLLLRLSGDHP